MPTLSSEKNITNRQLNFTLGPVDTYNLKQMPHKLLNYEIDGTWNHHQSIILDIILGRVFNGFYRKYKKLPQSWRSKQVINTVFSNANLLINPESLEILSLSPREVYIKKYMGSSWIGTTKEEYEYNMDSIQREKGLATFEQYLDNYFKNDEQYQNYKNNIQSLYNTFCGNLKVGLNLLKLFEAYPLLQNYRYTFFDHLKNIEHTKFKMIYKVKYIERRPTYDTDSGKILSRGNMIDLYYKMKDFQHLFKVDKKQDEIEINFDTPIGKLVLYNMLILDTDWCPIEAYFLTKNAYFLYKRFLLNKRSGKHKSKKIRLRFDDLKAFLDLKWSNDRGVHTIIIKALNDMIEKGLVDSFTWNKYFAKKRVYELSFEKEQQGTKEDEEVQPKILKMVASN